MGNVTSADVTKRWIYDVPPSYDDRRPKKLRSMIRSSSNRKAIKITLSYHSNSNCSSENESSYCSSTSSRKIRSSSNSRRFDSSRIRSRTTSNYRERRIGTNRAWHSALSVLLNTKLIQYIECYISYLKQHALVSDEHLWHKEWNIPSCRNLYDFLASYTKIVIGEKSHLQSELFAFRRLYSVYDYFIGSFYSYLNSIAEECTSVCNAVKGATNNELKRSFEFGDIDNEDIISMGRCCKRQKLSMNDALIVGVNVVRNSQFKELFSRFTDKNPVKMLNTSQKAMAALNRLYKMIMALNMNYQICNRPSKMMRSVKDGLFSLKFAPLLPAPQLPNFPQLPQLSQLSTMLSPYMTSVSTIKLVPSIGSIRLISYIASMTNIRSIVRTVVDNDTNNKIVLGGESNIFDENVDEKEQRFKEYIAMHTSHWGEEAYDHVEVRLCTNNDINSFGIPDTCTVM